MYPVEIKPGIYWVGSMDYSMRSFHGYSTECGSTYNAYLIIDEKVTLIDTVKAPFCLEMLGRIRNIIDPAKIDYIVSNHVEPDHSGGIPFMLQQCPGAKIVTSDPNGLKGLTGRYGEHDYVTVRAGDSISLGKRTLQFVPTPMLHWPDSMVTYCPEEEILFSNDGFGQHLATTERFADERDISEVMHQAKKYYANILMPYGMQAQKAISALAGLKISMIATGHGVSWRSNISDIIEAYQKWSSFEKTDKAVVVFDTMWHTTEIMAKNIADAFYAIGIKPVLFDLRTDHISDVATELLDAKFLAVGSPTLNNQMMPSIAGLLCYIKGLAPKGLKGFAFGSYGWGGQSIGQVEQALKDCKVEICLPMQKIMNTPNPKVLRELQEAVKGLK
ncbi:MAG: FprA family A-type flavoprotein [Selenomonadaceae bacterium]|nr:FprA family A-type flavoprotein [Selenomonadaceae bacterium]